jgi:hypothetical protein
VQTESVIRTVPRVVRRIVSYFHPLFYFIFCNVVENEMIFYLVELILFKHSTIDRSEMGLITLRTTAPKLSKDPWVAE